MTLPELCECGDHSESTMPTSNTTTNTPATTTSTTSTSNSIGQALKTVLEQAASEGRATCSLTGCVDLLAQHPDDVMLCVMPVLTSPDPAATIQSTLIRAVCQEHAIRVLAVDCDVKLAKAVCMAGEAEQKKKMDVNCNGVLKTPAACSDDAMLISDCDNLAPVMGFPCVLVQFPEDKASEEEELVAEFCKEQLYGHTHTDAYIELPD